MKALLEKLSLLSLSLMLVSTFSTSTALPQMISTFQQQGYAASQVEMLFSISSFAIMGMLVINPFLDRFLSERSSIILGLSFIAFGGSLPVVGKTYALVVVSRVLLGMGIGLINARAISIISENYQGNERAQMLGFRGSFEVLGNVFFNSSGRLFSAVWMVMGVYRLSFCLTYFTVLFAVCSKTSRCSGSG